MKASVLTAAAFLIAASATPLAAQSSDPSDAADQMQEVYQNQCGPSVPSFEIEINVAGMNIDARTSFDTRGELAVTTVCMDEFRIAAASEVRSVSEALAFMALREAEALWPVAEAKWGQDLGKLRTDLREVALRRKNSTAYARLSQGRTDSVRAMAYDLADVGYENEAIAALNEEAARLSTDRMMRKRRYDFERVMVALARASIVSKASGDAAGADVLQDFLEVTPDNNQHLLNVKINLAALLAESGQFQEAVDILEPAYREFRAFQEDSNRYKIGGSDREFAWILACAYDGLGDAQSASQYFDIVNQAEELPQDRYLPQTKPSSMIKLRLAACTNDQDEYLKVLYDGSYARLSGAWADLQSPRDSFLFHYRSDWTLPDAIKEQYLSQYRMLPENYSDALVGWMPSPADGG